MGLAFNLISPRRAMRILGRYDGWVSSVARRYGVPAAAVKAILYQEMTMIDLMDLVADFVVWTNLFHKKDSSTGYAQVFGYVGLNAANYAIDHDLATYESLGLSSPHRLDSRNGKDVRLVWRKLHGDAKANIELATLNLVVAADEVVGHTDFDVMTAEEMKLVLTRYNQDVRRVTPYGERAYRRYREFLG